MKEHIILEKAKRYNTSDENVTPSGCTYQSQEGFWVDDTTGEAMMKSNNSQKPTSKKCDIETGEDQKGE